MCYILWYLHSKPYGIEETSSTHLTNIIYKHLTMYTILSSMKSLKLIVHMYSASAIDTNTKADSIGKDNINGGV